MKQLIIAKNIIPAILFSGLLLLLAATSPYIFPASSKHCPTLTEELGDAEQCTEDNREADLRADCTNPAQQELADTILRFHIRANSDTEQDQLQKLEIKEAVLCYLAPLLENASTKEEVCSIIEAHLPEIIQVGEKITQPTETGRYVTASVTNCYFPIKTYGDMTFPSGYYDALEIEIGEGEGHNWWCVMYPQLCFVDLCYGTVPEESKEELQSQLSSSTYESLFVTESYSSDELSQSKPKIGFWLSRFFFHSGNSTLEETTDNR